MPRRIKTLAERLWQKTARRCSGCLEFTGHLTNGYGVIEIEIRKHRTLLKAHRVAWELTNGPVPDGLCVCHKCDNRRCCAPEHLFLGTVADNNRDMKAKGRQARGARLARALTETQAATVQAARAAGTPSIRSLAKEWGVDESTAHYASTGRNWGYLLPSSSAPASP